MFVSNLSLFAATSTLRFEALPHIRNQLPQPEAGAGVRLFCLQTAQEKGTLYSHVLENMANVVSTNYKKGVPDFAAVRWLHHNIPRDSISSEQTVSFLLGAAFKASAGVPPLIVLQGLSCPQATPNRRFGNVPCLWGQMHKAVFDHDCVLNVQLCSPRDACSSISNGWMFEIVISWALFKARVSASNSRICCGTFAIVKY